MTIYILYLYSVTLEARRTKFQFENYDGFVDILLKYLEVELIVILVLVKIHLNFWRFIAMAFNIGGVGWGKLFKPRKIAMVASSKYN